MVGDPSLNTLAPGQCFNAVAQVRGGDAQAATLHMCWHGETARCSGTFSAGATLTLYNVQYRGLLGGVHVLQILTSTKIVERPVLRETSFQAFKEVCAGIGGISVGFERLGGRCLAAVDHNPLACAALRQQPLQVIQGDIADPEVRRQVHLVQPELRCMLAAGIPCHSYSRQGLRQGFRDPRSHTLCHVLQLAWHSHACGIILECVTEIQRHPDALACLRDFAKRANFRISEVVLDLSHQWASKRLRWWAVLLPSNMPALALPSWPQSVSLWTVAQVIPEWPIWPAEEEAALLWDPAEIAAYSNPDFGQDDRTLASTAQAPTALHSWGNALRACPCGCRAEPFSEQSLRSRGLRGIGVPSANSLAQRFLHPREVALLNALPPLHPLPSDPRAALCLVGQLSSPLQALWIFAHIRRWAAEAYGSSEVHPMSELKAFQEFLLQQRQDFWLTPTLKHGGEFRFRGDVLEHSLHIPEPVTAGQLARLAKASLAPGHFVRVLSGDRILLAQAFLHPQPHGPVYEVRTIVKRARLDEEAGTDLQPRALSFSPFASDPWPPSADACACTPQPAATPCGSRLASVAPPVPPSGQGTSLANPTSGDPSELPEDIVASASLARSAFALPTTGCTDIAIWCGLAAIMQQCPDCSALQLPPRVADVLLKLALLGRPLPPSLAAAARISGDHLSLVPFVHHNHWTLLALRVQGSAAHATVLDGIPGRNTAAARTLAHSLCYLGGLCLESFCEQSLWQQQSQHDCGEVLLAHAISLLPVDANDSPIRTARALLAALPDFASDLVGSGGMSTEQERELQHLLVQKGVPPEAAAPRVQSAIAKLGSGALAAALKQRNQWQALKAAANKPGSLFKWVQADELQAHIASKAQDKFGTEVSRPRAKKQKPARKPFAAPLHIDPGQLQLAEGSFISKAGTPLKQLAYEEVQTQASGVCFCTVDQAGPFLALGRNLSVDALALATTAELSGDLSTRASALRYPAVFGPTQEAILVSGSLIQLGDEEVQLCATDIAEVDHLTTAVCRLSLFRDEYKYAWDKFCEAPLRTILQQVPEFQVCKSPTCGGQCIGFHAAVDEIVEHLFLDVWARQWVKLAGGRTKPADSELFQAFIRIPASALPHVFTASLDGLYFEPRAADGTGPHPAWAVVWLPGQSATQVQLALRTTDKAISVTRLGNKFGLRTKEADEQVVFELLRPHHQFLKVRVTARYRLHPLPHGFQRHNLVQLLKQWSWNCKPLQPDRGDSVGCAWIVGASCEPPAPALPLGAGFVLATKTKDVGQPRGPSKDICASLKTRRALLVDDDADSPPDPWSDGADPWSAARPVPASSSSSKEAVTKIAQLEAGLKQDLHDIVQRKFDERDAAGPPVGLSDQDKRLHSLETAVTEMRHQGAKFESWFQGFGTKVSDQATQLEALKATVQEQQAELGKVRTDLQSTVHNAVTTLQGNLTTQMAAQLAGQMEQIQGLFADKKSRH